MAIGVGDEAPDFELKDQTGQPLRLSDYRGKKSVVLVFHPLAFTGTCETEMCAIRDGIASFRNDDVEILAVSVDSPPVHRKWAEEQGFEFPMLADFWPHGAVAQAYGVFSEERGVALRGTFLIDKDGIVVYSEKNDIPEGRDPEVWLDALRRIGASD